MVPLVVMLMGWVVARSFGFAGWHQADSWGDAVRFALAAMFMFTAGSHFHPRTRPDLVRMVPVGFPSPSFLVTVTGFLEVAGAVGLLVPPTATAAACGLIALLVVLFPANIHAARAKLVVAGHRATPLVWRLPLQLFWIAALWWVAEVSAVASARV